MAYLKPTLSGKWRMFCKNKKRDCVRESSVANENARFLREHQRDLSKARRGEVKVEAEVNAQMHWQMRNKGLL